MPQTSLNVAQGDTVRYTDHNTCVADIADLYAKLAAIAGVPTGTVEALAYSGSLPAGFLACNGAAVSRTTYAALFAVLGTTYGAGDGSTTFNLPDLRGYFLRGWDNGRGIDTGRAIGTTQADTTGSHTHTYSGTTGAENNPPFSTGGTGSTTFQTSGWSHTHSYSGTTAANGAISSGETRPKNIAVNYVIKY